MHEKRGYEKGESLGLASTEERRICFDKEPSLCRRACAPCRFMLEMHLIRDHPSEVWMMNDATCILRKSWVCSVISRGTLKVHIFNFAEIIPSARAFAIQSIHLNIHIFFYPSLNSNLKNLLQSQIACWLVFVITCKNIYSYVSALENAVLYQHRDKSSLLVSCDIRQVVGAPSIDLAIKQAIFYRARWCISLYRKCSP